MTTPPTPSAPVIALKAGDFDVLVQASPVPGPSANGLAPRVDAPVGKLEDAFTQVENTIAAIASSTVQSIRNAAERAARPDHVEVCFGLCFSAGGGVIVAGASGEASLQVTLVYNGDPPKTGT